MTFTDAMMKNTKISLALISSIDWFFDSVGLAVIFSPVLQWKPTFDTACMLLSSSMTAHQIQSTLIRKK